MNITSKGLRLAIPEPRAAFIIATHTARQIIYKRVFDRSDMVG